MNDSVIKVLSDKEHVWARPQMYVGSTTQSSHINYIGNELRVYHYSPALLKIINEIIDNSIDEAIRTKFKHAGTLKVNFDATTGLIEVEDDGRGLPQTMIEVNGEHLPSCVVAWTMTKAGSNFTDDRTTIGANGVGSALTNYLSKTFLATTGNGTTTYEVQCKDGDLVGYESYPSKFKGTIVKFRPNYEFFDQTVGITHDLIMALRERLESLLITFPKLKVFLNDELLDNPVKELKQGDDNVFVNGKSFLLNIRSSEEINNNFFGKSYVNGVSTWRLGTHVDYIIDGIYSEIRPMIMKQYKVDIIKSRFIEGIQILLALREFRNPKFSSQTKERLINPNSDLSDHFNDELNFKKIATQFMKNEAIIEPIVAQAVARLEAQEKRNLKKLEKAVAKAKIPGHVQASRKDNSMLFLVEGESAMGWFIPCRNPKQQGAYALRGKVATTWNLPNMDIMKNKVLTDVMSILNLSITDKSISDLSYDYIGIFVDADPDGMGSIMPSLVSFFTRWPDLFLEGRIKIIRSPLHIIKSGKDEHWFYTNEEFQSFDGKIDEHKYVKGLGQLDKDEYSRVIACDSTYTVTMDENWKSSLELIYGKDTQGRKDWIQGE